MKINWSLVGTILLIAVVILYLLIEEYRQQDQLDGALYKMLANYKDPEAEQKPTNDQLLEKAIQINRRTSGFQRWRQSLIIALIVTLPIVYFLLKRVPTLFEWVIIASLIAFGIYFSYSWIYVHYLVPNTQKVEKNLQQLRELLVDELLLREMARSKQTKQDKPRTKTKRRN
jgi:preprotein translocase subunit SecY